MEFRIVIEVMLLTNQHRLFERYSTFDSLRSDCDWRESIHRVVYAAHNLDLPRARRVSSDVRRCVVVAVDDDDAHWTRPMASDDDGIDGHDQVDLQRRLQHVQPFVGTVGNRVD